MKAGIAPRLLAAQVKNSACWLWEDPRASRATSVLDDMATAEADHEAGGPGYLALLLAAHWATVATFVPTDVDARIRHHAWTAIASPEALAAACAVVDDVAAWAAPPVSARVLDAGPHGLLSGHDGEWLAVRAGALGRAAGLDDAIAGALASSIDAEIEREEAAMRAALEAGARPALTAATILAHNLGDLSRVVAEWPSRAAFLEPLRRRWTRLGHPDAPARRPLLVAAGELNKALVAHENHRFLPLRRPRALRASRDLLLPIGPWLDGWGRAIATSPHLEDRDRAEVLAALLEIHQRDPRQEGCLRAIAGLHAALPGGVPRLVPDLPARMRKDALRGRVREALDVTPEAFAARLERRFEKARV